VARLPVEFFDPAAKQQLLDRQPLDCRKLYFDEQRDMDPRYRIIYRLLPDEDGPTKVEVPGAGSASRMFAGRRVLAPQTSIATSWPLVRS